MATKKDKTETGEGSVDVTVFVPRSEPGKPTGVREGDILKAALLAARDDIPVAAFITNPEIDPDKVSDVKTKDGQEGRDYTVTIHFTPRRTTDPEGEHEAVTVDKVMATLEPLTPEKLAEATGTAQEA
jgi:hypothetical protein